MAALLISGLAACGRTQDNQSAVNLDDENAAAVEDSSEVNENEETDTTASNVTPETESMADDDEEQKDETDIMIVYFSRSGNTKFIAEMIQEQTQGELFQIETAVPYADDYDTVLDQAQQEQRENARPELSAYPENIEDKQMIFIGYPIWWGDTPMAMLTFLENYDFTGKTVIPFCTHGGGGAGSSFSTVENAVQGAEVLEGFSVSGSGASGAEGDVADWLRRLNIIS